MADYIKREDAIDAAAGWGDRGLPLAILEDLKTIPAADVVDGEAYRELLRAARNMHLWIFRNTCNELEAYDECGLSDEMNNLLGYGGKLTIKMDGGEDDE